MNLTVGCCKMITSSNRYYRISRLFNFMQASNHRPWETMSLSWLKGCNGSIMNMYVCVRSWQCWLTSFLEKYESAKRMAFSWCFECFWTTSVLVSFQIRQFGLFTYFLMGPHCRKLFFSEIPNQTENKFFLFIHVVEGYIRLRWFSKTYMSWLKSP